MGQIFKRQIHSHATSGKIIAVDIKPLHCLDIEAVKSISEIAFNKGWGEKDFAYFIAHDSGCCWGVFKEKRLIGYFLALLVQGELDIISVAVEKEFRRWGIAEMLLVLVWELAEVKRAFLEVEAGNTPAIRLYEKVGYRQYGLRKKYYAGLKDAVVMKKEKVD